MRDSCQVVLFGDWEEIGFRGNSLNEPGATQVIGPAHQQGGLEIPVSGQFGDGFEESAAKNQVIFLDLLLEGNCMGRYNALTLELCGVD